MKAIGIRQYGDADALFRWHAEGQLRVTIDREFPLAQATKAHHYHETARTRGKLLLRFPA